MAMLAQRRCTEEGEDDMEAAAAAAMSSTSSRANSSDRAHENANSAKMVMLPRTGPTKFEFPYTLTALFLIDRTVDLISPFLTPHTYSATIAEVLPLQHGLCKKKNYVRM